MTLLRFALVLVFVALVAGVRGGVLRAAAWLVLLYAAAQAELNLYVAGPVVGYHHFRPHGAPGVLWGSVAVVAAQVALVAFGLWWQRHALRDFAAASLRGWRLLAFLALVAAFCAKPSRPASTSAFEFVFAALTDLAALGNVFLAVRALPEDALARIQALWQRCFGAWGDGPEPTARAGRCVWALALASGAASLCLCLFVYDAHPHVPDEVVYLLHARYLAAGQLWLPAPPVPAAFDVDLMLLDGARWYCPVNPGWPLALALGELVHAPWLVDPLLGAASVLLAFWFVREIACAATARLAAALLALSPWFLFMNMSFMTHSWTLFCGLVAALGVARARRSGASGWAWLAGAAIGMVALIRPLEGLVLALLLGLWALGLGGARLRFAPLAGLVAATALVGALVLPYNRALTGSARVFPINHYVDQVYGPGKNDLGFGPDKGLGWGLDAWPGHSPLEAAVNAQINTFAIHAELFGWCTGSLVLVWFLLCAGRLSRNDRLMLVFVGAIVLSNSLYWFHGGPDFAARYWYLAILPAILLSISGLRALEARATDPRRVHAALAALTLLALCAWVPWRASDKYKDYRGMRAGVRELAAEKGFGRSLVLVEGERHPDYASAAVYNPLDPEADQPIYAWDRSTGVRKELLEHYRDRTVWIVAGPTLTRDGFQLVQGPLSAAAMLEELAR